MSEQQEVLADLAAAGILAGVRWAYLSATSRALETYSEADGHDTAWLGNTRFTLFRNRLDRVFACDRYAVHSGDDDADLDVLYDQLSEHDIATMPRVAPGLVRRCDLNGSPGWAAGRRRFLLASCVFGRLDLLPWPQKSPTKQRVAVQRSPQPLQPSLFEAFAPEEVGGLELALADGSAGTAGTAEPAGPAGAGLATFVVAHSLDPLSQRVELAIGRPRLNPGGGPAWHWRQDLLELPPADGGRRGGTPPPPTQNPVPDAQVRLRERAQPRGEAASGGRVHGER